jgi:hypothetical protein
LRDLWAQPGPFTLAELAAACRCSVRYLQKAIAAGALDVRRLGRAVRVPASEARRFALAAGAEPNRNEPREPERTDAHPATRTLARG